MVKMPPDMSGREIVKRFERLGYSFVRQSGSHMRLMHPKRKPLTVPDHRSVAQGILRKLLRDAKITLEEFMKLK